MVDVEMTGVDGLPRVRMRVPRFAARWSALPAAYELHGGSAKEPLMVSITVRTVGSCFAPERACPEQKIVAGQGYAAQYCAVERGALVNVEHEDGADSICCSVRWKRYGPLTAEHERIIRGVAPSCLTRPQTGEE